MRLAELVGALSLGVDLGFGQPMEHVLRQCLIALRLAERPGSTSEARAVVYYTALLVNVGCHTDAHEQAKWFGDDIALKSSKYDYEFRSLRAAAAAMPPDRRGQPAAAPLPRRARVRAVAATASVDGMIAEHARAARARSASSSACRDAVLDALGSCVRAVGRARLAGRACEGDAIPLAARSRSSPSSSRSRTGSAESRRRASWRASAAGKQFDPALAALSARRRRARSSTGSTASAPGTR